MWTPKSGIWTVARATATVRIFNYLSSFCLILLKLRTDTARPGVQHSPPADSSRNTKSLTQPQPQLLAVFSKDEPEPAHPTNPNLALTPNLRKTWARVGESRSPTLGTGIRGRGRRILALLGSLPGGVPR